MLSCLFSSQPQKLASEAASTVKCILRSNEYKNAAVLLSFMPTDTEINIIPLLMRAAADKKIIALPRVALDKTCMEFHYMSSAAPLEVQTEQGAFGIREPLSTLPILDVEHFPESSLMLVPGLAFDAHGRRLGHGKGYYDRYLARVRKTNGTSALMAVIGVCFSCQMLQCVPCNILDINMSHVACSEGLFVCD